MTLHQSGALAIALALLAASIINYQRGHKGEAVIEFWLAMVALAVFVSGSTEPTP